MNKNLSADSHIQDLRNEAKRLGVSAGGTKVAIFARIVAARNALQQPAVAAVVKQPAVAAAPIVQDTNYWIQKAATDFGLSKDAFLLSGDTKLTPQQRYDYVKSLVPTRDSPAGANLKDLNKMAIHWDQNKNFWEFIMDYLIYPNMYEAPELQNEPVMTEAQADAYTDELLGEDPLEIEFVPANRIYLTCSYEYTKYIDGERAEQLVNLKSLIRHEGEGKGNITMRDILENTRVFFPVTWGRIHYYEFTGFSPEGIPTLKVHIGF